jgi:hypothetical protein
MGRFPDIRVKTIQDSAAVAIYRLIAQKCRASGLQPREVVRFGGAVWPDFKAAMPLRSFGGQGLDGRAAESASRSRRS